MCIDLLPFCTKLKNYYIDSYKSQVKVEVIVLTTAEVLKWTCPSSNLDKPIVKFGDIRIKMLSISADSVRPSPHTDMQDGLILC